MIVLIRIYILTVLVPEWLGKLWGVEMVQRHTYFICKAGTQWRALSANAAKVFPINGKNIFEVTSPKSPDGPIPIPEEILKGYLEGKDTIVAVQEKISKYLEGYWDKEEDTEVAPDALKNLETAVQAKQEEYDAQVALLDTAKTNLVGDPDNQKLKDDVVTLEEARKKAGKDLGIAKGALTKALK